MSSVSDALAAVALLLLLMLGTALRGKVFGRRRKLAEAERLLRAKRPSGDLRWSMAEWDWALKEVRTTKALRHVAAQSEDHPA